MSAEVNREDVKELVGWGALCSETGKELGKWGEEASGRWYLSRVGRQSE